MRHPAEQLIVDGLIQPRKLEDVPAFEGHESVAEAAARWGTLPRNVTRWCCEGRIAGAFQLGSSGKSKRPWVIPKGSVKPEVAQGRPVRQLVLVDDEWIFQKKTENSAERAAPLKQKQP